MAVADCRISLGIKIKAGGQLILFGMVAHNVVNVAVPKPCVDFYGKALWVISHHGFFVGVKTFVQTDAVSA